VTDQPGASEADAVDELVGQWRRKVAATKLDPGDLDAMGTGARLLRAAHHFSKAMHDLHATYGLQFWEYDVLATLYRAGDPGGLSGKALIRASLITSGAITNRVDKLVARGLVERRTDPSDRRSMLVALTDEGRELVERVTPAHTANEADVLGCLTSDERAALDTLLRKFLVSLGDVSLSE
jgi:DNA-binding MarR family transcriptional regulator